MKQLSQEDLQSLSSTFSKLLKRRLGKGPENCNVMYRGSQLYVHMRNFMTPAEEVLVNTKKVNLAVLFRSSVIDTVVKEYIPEASRVIDHTFDLFYQDWNYQSNTGMLLLENGKGKNEKKIEDMFDDGLYKLIEEVGSYHHKSPSSIRIVKYTQNMCAIETKEVLSQLGRLVYEKNNMDILIRHEQETKKGYLKNKKLFERVFNRLIDDIFIMWDYENDRCYLIFLFMKENLIN